MRPRAKWVLAFFLVLSSSPLPSAAQEVAPIRLLLRVDSDAAALVATRIRGQLSEFDMSVVEVRAAAVEPGLAEQLATAHQLASVHDAQAVVWLDLSAPTTRVLLLDIRTSRLFARDVDGAALLGEDGDSSAEREQAALAVRTAVGAMITGHVIGLPEQEVVAPEPVVPAPVAPESVAAESAPERVEQMPQPAHSAGEGADVRGSLGAGWRFAWDGVGSLGAHVLGIDGDVRVDALLFGARVGFGLPELVEHPLASFALSRHELKLLVGAHVLLLEALRFESFVEVGATVAQRQTQQAAIGVRAADDSWLFSFTVGARVALVWHPVPVFGVRLVVGIDVVSPPPSFVLAGASPEVSWEMETVQPVLGLDLRIFFPEP